MGPSRFGAAGKLAFTFGNPAQQDGAAVAEYAYQHGWHTADVVTDKLLVYFQNVCQAFTLRFQQLGGKIVDQESFTQGDKTIGNVATRDQRQDGERDRLLHVVRHRPAGVRRRPAHARQQDADHRRLGERRGLLVVEEPEDHQLLLPHLRVGADAGSVRGGATRSRRRWRRSRQPAQTGGFITGADAIDAIVYAIKTGGRLDQRGEARRDPAPT